MLVMKLALLAAAAALKQKPSCDGWRCSPGFVRNEAYHGNAGTSDEQCCDITCSGAKVTCPAGHVMKDPHKPGVNATECCSATCASVACAYPKTSWPKGSPHLSKVSTDPLDCCQDSCAAISCPTKSAHLPAKLSSPATSPADCCAPTCESVSCPNGFEHVKDKLSEVAGDGQKCCQQKCGDLSGEHGFQCSQGWKPLGDARSCVTQPCNDMQCCMKTCQVYACPESYVSNPAHASAWPADDDTCCQKTCQIHQCGAGYVPGSNFQRNHTVGEASSVCCDKTCSLHQCSKGALVPGAGNITGGSDDVCCEPSLCALFRNLTKSKNTGCNFQDEGSCHGMYTSVNNTKLNKTEDLRCTWEASLGLCRLGNTKKPEGCRD